MAKKYIDRLIKYGWLDERNGYYESGIVLSFNAVSIYVASAFKNILNPKLITYKGKLFKVSSLLDEIDKQSTPTKWTGCSARITSQRSLESC